ncbi:MAG: TPM domain-containing protein [Gallionellaceae bacterium]|jgi:uncharacterized membrane protein
MDFRRIIKHLSVGHAAVQRCFSRAALRNIENTIAGVEQTYAGQIRFAVEHALDLRALVDGQSARQRAIEVFSQLHVWDTEHNNGVLIYLLLADRDVEIIADRGVLAELGQTVLESVCMEMEALFRQGKFEEGVIAGIRTLGVILARHYPNNYIKYNELSNDAVIL